MIKINSRSALVVLLLIAIPNVARADESNRFESKYPKLYARIMSLSFGSDHTKVIQEAALTIRNEIVLRPIPLGSSASYGSVAQTVGMTVLRSKTALAHNTSVQLVDNEMNVLAKFEANEEGEYSCTYFDWDLNQYLPCGTVVRESGN